MLEVRLCEEGRSSDGESCLFVQKTNGTKTFGKERKTFAPHEANCQAEVKDGVGFTADHHNLYGSVVSPDRVGQAQ
jgi:hypothetical protein